MFKVTSSVFLLLFINESIGYLVKVNRKYLKSDVDHVIDKYIGSYKKIKAEFPNHMVELELKIQGTNTHPSANNFVQGHSIQRRYMPGLSRQRKELKRVGSSSDTNMSGTTPRAIVAQTTTGRSTITPVTAITTTTPVTPTTSTAPVTSNDLDPDPAKKLVYMDDLKKALDDFKNKHLKYIMESQTVKLKQNESISTPGELRNIDDILKLIKKGVQIKNHAPKPNEDGLDWFQIKIPKTL